MNDRRDSDRDRETGLLQKQMKIERADTQADKTYLNKRFEV